VTNCPCCNANFTPVSRQVATEPAQGFGVAGVSDGESDNTPLIVVVIIGALVLIGGIVAGAILLIRRAGSDDRDGRRRKVRTAEHEPQYESILPATVYRSRDQRERDVNR
jgi:hypothetical protein